MFRSSWRVMLLLITLPACSEPAAAPAPATTAETKPEATDPQPPPRFDPPPEVAGLMNDDAGKWLAATSLRDDATGGHLTGRYIAEENKIIVDTENLDAFVMHSDRAHIDWTRRVVLRIDGQTSELARRENPAIEFQRTPNGDWNVVSK